MKTLWDQLVDAQYQAIGRVTAESHSSTFEDVCATFVAMLPIVGMTWERGRPDGMPSRMYAYSEGEDQDTTLQTVQLDDGTLRNAFRFELQPGIEVPEAVLRGVALTIVAVCNQAGAYRSACSAADNAGEVVGHALTDHEGHLLDADDTFEQFIRRHDPQWDGDTLPMPLDVSPKAQRTGMTWKGLFFYVDVNETSVRLRVRPDRRLPDISPRELQVAERIASGMTFKEVARDLEMAPSTASTHLYKVYDKLGINRRSALVEWLRENSATA